MSPLVGRRDPTGRGQREGAEGGRSGRDRGLQLYPLGALVVGHATATG